jgi:hypothetical protein
MDHRQIHTHDGDRHQDLLLMIEDTALQLRAKLRAFGVSLNQLGLPASSDYPL